MGTRRSGQGIRVIAGSAKGRRLTVPGDVRPSTGRVREAVFSMLGDVSGRVVLDVCAGSGALGVEALSRGAAHAVFIDADRRVCATLRKNLEKIGFDDRATVVPADAVGFLAVSPVGDDDAAPASLVLCDPPYDWSPARAAGLFSVLAESPHVAPRARLVLELPARGGMPDLPPRWRSSRERTYGDTLVLVVDT